MGESGPLGFAWILMVHVDCEVACGASEQWWAGCVTEEDLRKDKEAGASTVER